MSSNRKTNPQWEQKTQAASMLMVMVLVVLLVQLWLLTSAMENFLSGHTDLASPTFLASGACFLVNLWLVRYLSNIDSNSNKE